MVRCRKQDAAVGKKSCLPHVVAVVCARQNGARREPFYVELASTFALIPDSQRLSVIRDRRRLDVLRYDLSVGAAKITDEIYF